MEFRLELPELYVNCSNYTLPITISWDRSLFHADILTENGGDTVNFAILEDGYFFHYDSKAGLNMHLHDSVEIPEGSGSSVFPFFIQLVRGHTGTGTLFQIEVTTYPNPSSDFLKINSPALLEKVEVWDLSGRLMYSMHFSPSNTINIDVSSYAPGVYFLVAVSGEKHGVTKFVKAE